MLKALIVEDDILFASRLKNTIQERFEVEICKNGEYAVKLIDENNYDLIITDSILPKLNALGIINKLADKGAILPIIVIVLSELSDEKAKIMSYPMVEYFVKNNPLNNLLPIIENLLQRFNNKQEASIIKYKDLTIDLSKETAKFGDVTLDNLKGKYLDLLYFFVLNNNIILKKEEIFDRVWGVNSKTNINAIEVYISGLRKELKRVGCEEYLKTIRGIGYSLS